MWGKGHGKATVLSRGPAPQHYGLASSLQAHPCERALGRRQGSRRALPAVPRGQRQQFIFRSRAERSQSTPGPALFFTQTAPGDLLQRDTIRAISKHHQRRSLQNTDQGGRGEWPGLQEDTCRDTLKRLRLNHTREGKTMAQHSQL